MSVRQVIPDLVYPVSRNAVFLSIFVGGYMLRKILPCFCHFLLQILQLVLNTSDHL